MSDLTLVTRPGAPSFNPSTIPALSPLADDMLGWIQRTGVAAVDITAGEPVRFDTNGKWVLAQADTAPHALAVGIALRNVKAGSGLTVVRVGTLDGFDLSGLAYGAPVYLSDTAGKLGTTAGTVTLIVGRVVPGHAVAVGSAYDKLLEVILL